MIQDLQVFSLFRPASSNSTNVDAELKEAKGRIDSLEGQLAEYRQELTRIRQENDAYSVEMDKLKKDQEDLLVLLADQDGQIRKYKERLKSLGQTVLSLKSFQMSCN